MLNNFIKLVLREKNLGLKNISMLFAFSTFFITSLLIFIFSLGSNMIMLDNIYKPFIWIILIFSMMLSSDNFLQNDFNDGSLKELQFLGYSEEIIFLSKCLVMWTMIIIPILFIIPLLVVFFNLDFLTTLNLLVTIFLATPSLTLISVLSSLFSIQLKRNKIIQFIIVFPFYIPVLIFSTSSNNFLEETNKSNNNFLILIAIFFITLPICVYISKLIIREINK